MSGWNDGENWTDPQDEGTEVIMGRLAVNCARCQRRVDWNFEGSLTIKGGKFPEVICPDCRDVLEQMNNPDLKKGRYKIGQFRVRMAPQENAAMAAAPEVKE